MKAFELREYIGPGGLELVEVPSPAAGDDDVLVSVRAIGVNFPDLLMTKGQYQLKPALPVVPGCEVAGVVMAAPLGSDLAVGEEVVGFTWSGGFAEQVAIPQRSVARIPHGLSLEQAAGVMVNYHTTLFALQRRAGIVEGDRVLVMGAAGGIGTAAVQVARGLGAHVVAGVADEDQCELALAAGAHSVLVLESGFAAAARALLGPAASFDIVVDPLGDWLFGEALRVLAPEGRLVTVGFAAGEIPTVAVNRLLLRNVSVVGAAFGAFLDIDPALMAQQARTLDTLAAGGAIRPMIESVSSLEELPTLLERLERGEIAGKAVVTLPPVEVPSTEYGVGSSGEISNRRQASSSGDRS